MKGIQLVESVTYGVTIAMLVGLGVWVVSAMIQENDDESTRETNDDTAGNGDDHTHQEARV